MEKLNPRPNTQPNEDWVEVHCTMHDDVVFGIVPQGDEQMLSSVIKMHIDDFGLHDTSHFRFSPFPGFEGKDRSCST